MIMNAVLRRCRAILASALVCVAAFTAPGAAPAATPTEGAFDAANKLYEQGKYAQAASAYEQMLKSGRVSAPLCFNLGNALFKSGHIGRAIAAYTQAQRLTPRDPDIRANLQFARNLAHGPTLLPNRWQRWLGDLTLNEWSLLAAASVWIWLILLIFLQWRPALRPHLRATTWSLGVVAALLCGCLWGAWYEIRLQQTAIVVTAQAAVHRGPLREASVAFTAHDGAELRVLDHKDRWLEVMAGPGRRGWIRHKYVLVLNPN
jgi:tetratricopeptide (TPR) repeat protein